jgi:hypothetical protein
MIGFIGNSLQLQSTMTAHNQWLTTTRSIPYWSTSVFSSIVMNDERWITAHTLNSMNDESLATEIYLTELTSRCPEYRSPPQTVPSFCYYLFCPLLRNNRGPTVDCVTSRMCFPKRCLANGHIPSQYVLKIPFWKFPRIFVCPITLVLMVTLQRQKIMVKPPPLW